nr:MAG TPA: hypothetical protein [Bacteriophage sp.]
MEHFAVYTPKATPTPPAITIIDLIPVGRDNTISRDYLVTLCVQHGLVKENLKDKDRAMRDLVGGARKEYVVLNLSDGNGYYRPTLKEFLDLQRHIRQIRSRINKEEERLKPELALYEDYKRGRLTE